MLLASTPYQAVGVDRARAELKSRFLADFATRVIHREHRETGQAHASTHRRGPLAHPPAGTAKRRLSAGDRPDGWLKFLLLPPTLNVLLVWLGLMLGLRRLLRGALLAMLGWPACWLLATPWPATPCARAWSPPAAGPAALRGAQAIVILGGGRDYVAPEFGWGDAPANATWRRLAYGAHLHRESGCRSWSAAAASMTSTAPRPA
jgi:hypothetical protein